MKNIQAVVNRFLGAKKARKPRVKKPRTKNFNSHKVQKVLNKGRNLWHKLR